MVCTQNCNLNFNSTFCAIPHRVWLNEHKRDKCWTTKKERYKSDPRKKSKDPNNDNPNERDETSFPCSTCQSNGHDIIFDTQSALITHYRQSHENQVASTLTSDP